MIWKKCLILLVFLQILKKLIKIKIENYEGVWDENKEEKEPCSLSKIYLLFIDQIQDMNEDVRKSH